MFPMDKCCCDDNKNVAVTRGDDTNAFGFTFMTIELEDLDGALEEHTVTRAEFQCGPVLKVLENPEFPLDVNLTREETKILKSQNKCFLRVYDEEGLRITCEGELEFGTRKEVINEG